MSFKEIPNLVIYFKFSVTPAAIRTLNAIQLYIVTIFTS